MIEIIKELNIEVSKPNVFQAVVAKQYDMNTRFIKATFVDNGDKITIDHTATVKVVINALRPDGESKGFEGEVNNDGTVTVPLHSWMLEQVGTVTCDISVIDIETDDNKKLTTTSFTLYVEKAAFGGSDITTDSQFDVLVALMDAATVAQEAVDTAEEAKRRAESVQGIYIGSGDMPEGYSVQIDDTGAVLEMDTELNAESPNPVANAAITREIKTIQSTLDGLGNRFAPSGFGLGTDCAWVDWNNAAANGFYRGTANSPDGYAWYGYVVKSTDDYIVQHAFTVNTAHGFATHCVRVKNVDKWEPWEYVNPPMISGVEYRTTERFLGKPVYTKLWSVEEGTESIDAKIGKGVVDIVVDIHGMVKFEMWESLYQASNAYVAYSADYDYFQLPYGGVPTANTWYIVMKYTKA